VEQHLGRLQVLGAPAGAKVKVDDRDVGELPMAAPVRVTAGEVVISVTAPGHIPINRKVTVQPGASMRETIVLHATEAGAPAPASPPAEPPRAPEPAPAPAQPLSPSAAEPAAPGHAMRLAGWITLGVTGVALAVGIAENLSYLGKRSDFDGTRSGGACGSALPDRGGTGCASLYDDMQSAKTGAIVGFAAAAALGLGSAALFYFAPSGAPTEARVACAVQSAGAGCRIRF
jgi:hypothetical protein